MKVQVSTVTFKTRSNSLTTRMAHAALYKHAHLMPLPSHPCLVPDFWEWLVCSLFISLFSHFKNVIKWNVYSVLLLAIAFSLIIILWRVAEYIKFVPFYCWLVFHWLDVPQWSHSSFEGHLTVSRLGLLQVRHLQTFMFCVNIRFHSSGINPRHAIAKS